jgi:DNA uptake protein ComE-like DNA-binding protein
LTPPVDEFTLDVNQFGVNGMKALIAGLVAALAVACSPAYAKQSAPKAPVVRAAAAAPVDINSATKEQLDALKGVGPARADAIIKGRPYKGKDDLIKKNILPKSVYDGIKDAIVAKQK